MFDILLYTITNFASSIYILVWVKVWSGEKRKNSTVLHLSYSFKNHFSK